MKNCLVTKLKARTGNMNLPIINGIILEVKSATNGDFYFESKSGLSIKIIDGDGALYDSQGLIIDDLSGKGRLVARYYSPTSSNGKLLVKSKYEIKSVSSDYDIFKEINYKELKYSDITEFANINQSEFDFDFIKNWPNLKIIKIKGDKTNGDLSVFAKEDMQTLIFTTVQRNENLVGNIQSFAVSVNLKKLHLSCPNVTGELESLLSGLYNNGKLSGTLNIYLGPKCSFNSLPILYNENFMATFSESGISVTKNGVTAGTYNGNDWSYV